MKERVGMGVVGAGAIGMRGAMSHLSMSDIQDRVRLVAVCDPVPGRAQAAAEKFGVDASYETFEKLLADPNVDAVTMCSPINVHIAKVWPQYGPASMFTITRRWLSQWQSATT